MTTRRQFSAEEKIQIFRLHLLERKPVSEICEQYQLNPNVFYRWQKELFDHGAAAFERADNGAANRTTQKLQKEVTQLRTKVASKDEVISEIMAEQVRLRKHLAWAERGLGRRHGGRGSGFKLRHEERNKFRSRSLASLSLRNTWLLPEDFGIMTDYLKVGFGEQEQGERIDRRGDGGAGGSVHSAIQGESPLHSPHVAPKIRVSGT